MVNKCCAFGCKSGYASQDATDVRITFHSFPRDEELRAKWIRANPRKDFTPTNNSRMCSLHFAESDFVEQHCDSNSSRHKSFNSPQLQRRYLKKDAVPSIFSEAPSYLSSPATTPRQSAARASACGRRLQEVERLVTLEEAFTANDSVQSLTPDELLDKLTSEAAVPQSFRWTVIDGALVVYRLQMNDDFVPAVQASVTVKADLSVVVTVKGEKVSSTHYRDIMNTSSLETMSQLLNLMARVKAWSDGDEPAVPHCLLDTAVTCLQQHIDSLDEDSEQLSFIVEQLKLLTTNKYSRHYSPQLTVLAYLVHATSCSAYEVLLHQNVLCLPSVRTLGKITRHVNTNTGLDNTAYLKLRFAKLNAFQRTVLLIIDEIYIAKRVEYCAGKVEGLTAEGTAASTLLCFMIKSVVGKYKDIVAIYPVAGLTAVKQHECYEEVMSTVHEVGFNVVAISVDNAATNRKFFTDCLCSGSLQTSIIDSRTAQPTFLLFDSVHNFKNIYNNFQSRKHFHCPIFEQNLPDGCQANFAHISDLYNHEAAALLKKAHKLSPVVLNPHNVERTSVKLAASVFSESTKDALRYYATHEGKAEWTGTADFITVILKLWNVVNVKSSCKGKHKREISMDPVRSSQDWKLSFLREFADFLKRWEAPGNAGLTRETFLALRHTCLALADCASFLLDRLGFSFVLLGQLQSDAIESRFGWLRQMAGANYFVSMRQVTESDRKIRALSLLKFSKISLEEVENAIHADVVKDKTQSDADSIADSIADALKLDVQPTVSDQNIIFYVSGAIGRSIVRRTKCEHCRESLICSSLLPTIAVNEDLEPQASVFLDSINRGGLVKPTDFTFQLVVHCWRVFEEVCNTQELKSKFLQSTAHRLLFCKIMDRATYTAEYMHLLFGASMCSAGHDLQTHIVGRFFNCVAKNLVKQFTSSSRQSTCSTAKKRKIDKLSSSSNH